jgi:hypothetical protein
MAKQHFDPAAGDWVGDGCGLCTDHCTCEEGTMTQRYFQVEAEVVAADGGSDAHYSLCGTFTADELASLLAEALQDNIRHMLLRGGKDPVGHELRVTIRDANGGTNL